MKEIIFSAKHKLLKTFLFVTFSMLVWNNFSFSQTFQVVSVSPSFNEISENENPEISVEFNIPTAPASFNNISFAVKGERSAYHTGQLNFTNENKTVSFISENIFNAGERVSVNLSKNILSAAGDSLKGFSWTFRIPSQPKPLNFSEPVSYGGGGYGMQCVDMNNDGYPDIVTSSGIIWINDGNGQFSTYWDINDADGFYPIIVDNFNRDGYMDVFYTGTGGLTLGLGNGTGNFNKSYYPWWFIDYISEDFNNDGFPDIAGYNILSNNPPFGDTTSYWAIAFNDGSGQLNDTIWAGQLTGWFRGIASDDVDNDGDLDMLLISHPAVTPSGTYGLDGLVVFKNSGQYNFDEYQLYPANLYLISYFPKFLYPSDFNNDGLIDIGIIGDAGGVLTLNMGNGFFGDGSDTTFIREIWGSENAAPLTGGDINGDSWIDLAVSGFGFPFDPQWPKQYGILRNYDGYFPGINLMDTLGVLIFNNATADLNSNGYLDLVHSGNGVHLTYSMDITPSVDDNSEFPVEFILYQNYPNPFNNQTEISFRINETGTIKISIYNILGEEVRLLENKVFLPGNYRVEWNGKGNNDADLPSGAYIIRANFRGTIHQDGSSRIIKSLFLK